MVTAPDNEGTAGLKGSFMWRISPPLLLVLLAAGAAGLRDVHITVPEAAAAGDTVSLICKYDLETDSLYSVKWYKGRQEFFRYIPKELPHTRVFPLEGVDVDVGRSGSANVVLRGVSPALSGRYRCEVSADAPTFHTAMKTSYMHVVELPESAPIILAEKSRVSVGEMIKIRCIAPQAHPPANLTWIINDKIVPGTPIHLDQNDEKSEKSIPVDSISKHNLRRELNKFNRNKSYEEYFETDTKKHNDLVTKIYDTEEHTFEGSLEDKQSNEINFSDSRAEEEVVTKRRSGSILSMQLTQDVFQQGQLRIVCRASVFSLYRAEAQLILDEDKPQLALILGNKQSNNINNSAVPINWTPSFAIRISIVLLLKYVIS